MPNPFSGQSVRQPMKPSEEMQSDAIASVRKPQPVARALLTTGLKEEEGRREEKEDWGVLSFFPTPFGKDYPN